MMRLGLFPERLLIPAAIQVGSASSLPHQHPQVTPGLGASLEAEPNILAV